MATKLVFTERQPILLYAGAAALVAAIVVSWMVTQDRAIREAATGVEPAAIIGPPCPSVSQGRFSGGLRPTIAFELNHVVFERRFGEVRCDWEGIASRAFPPVCEFSGPTVLAVRTARGTFDFQPGSGQPATISLRDGVPSCVVASPYWTAYYRAATDTDSQGRLTPIDPNRPPSPLY